MRYITLSYLNWLRNGKFICLEQQEPSTWLNVSKRGRLYYLLSWVLKFFYRTVHYFFFRDEVSLLHVFFKNEFIVQYKRDQLYGIEDLVCKSGFVILCTKKNTCLSQLLHSALITFQTKILNECYLKVTFFNSSIISLDLYSDTIHMIMDFWLFPSN